jgi:hypothetical protein
MTILFGFLLVVSITGIIGNLIVTSVYINKNDKATSSFFILVLAFSDLVVCSILIPFTIFIEASNFQIESILFCKLYYFITTTIVPNGCFLMVSIAFDRFFCICQVNFNLHLHQSFLSELLNSSTNRFTFPTSYQNLEII